MTEFTTWFAIVALLAGGFYLLGAVNALRRRMEAQEELGRALRKRIVSPADEAWTISEAQRLRLRRTKVRAA